KHFNNSLRCIANYVFRTSVLKAKGGFVDFPLAWFSDDATVLMMAGNGAANTMEMLFYFRNSERSISCRSLSQHDSYQKAYAGLIYDKWFSKIKGQLFSPYNSKIYWKRSLWLIESEHRKLMYGSFMNFALNCNLGDYMRLLTHIPGLKKKIKLLYTYGYHRLYLITHHVEH
ncbi:MAG: hypothetical protein ACI36X_05335, partial [Bacteroidaceae bacterium]